ncbi:transcription initiation factor TFIID subunit 2 [Nematocida sp. LUAm3]|nr:transcription initiation factor TFIID subunit 2 [Nematocida sp. LUAm3]KAI5174543.1 transcription initiation factor TFIID subunit 2 [Nematocida sp. LUAm2]KAI5178051.1 transcription initiation factor TFIID subunit 2 [Nematocida sp. LUAm1]
MQVLHQKNIVYINAEKETYSGRVIFLLQKMEEDTKLDIKASQLLVEKKEIFIDGAWKEAQETVPRNTEKIRLLFRGAKYHECVSFYKNEDYIEFVGGPVEKQGHTLFPEISEAPREIETMYIIRKIEGFSLISSGQLVGIYDGGTTKTFHYKVESGRASEIIFSGGRYEEASLGRISIHVSTIAAKKLSEGKKETMEVLRASLSTAQSLLEQKLPFSRVHVVFSMCEVEMLSGRGCCVLNISQMMIPEAIDQCFSGIRTLSSLIAHQYFGILSYPVQEADQWVYTGLQNYLADLICELFLGMNEVRYMLNRDMEYVQREDIEEPPLSSSFRERSSFSSDFFIKKSRLFIHTLENNLTRAFMQKIMKEVLDTKTSSTHDLIRIVKGITGKDVRHLFDSYVFRSGIPVIIAHIEQNSRVGSITVILKQKIHSIHHEANRQILGNICVRVYETESVVDHSLFVGATSTLHEISYQQRSQRRKQKTEEGSSLLWVRIDPNLEWMKISVVEQPDYMFAEQLVSEKDVYGQMEALAGVQKNPSESVCTVLERVMDSAQMFYKVSIAAGTLLAKSINEESGYFGFQRVVQFFITNYCIQNTTIVKSNEFSQFRSYFIQKNIAASMSLCQLDAVKNLGERTVRAKNVVSAFLLNLMRYNDNTENAYEDSFYLADIITALSIALCSDAYLDTTPFVLEIERLRKKDLIFPSHQNVITCSSIKALTRLALQGYIDISIKALLMYSEQKNFYKVRMAAYDALITLFPNTGIIPYLLERSLIESRRVRIHILHSIRESTRCAYLPVFEHVKKEKDQLLEIRKIFCDDSETEKIIDDIVKLITEKTEIVEDIFGEENIFHDLSSDGQDAPENPKIIIKLSKPLILRIPLSNLPREEPVALITREEVDALYLADEYAEKHFLDATEEKAVEELFNQLKTNRIYAQVAQNAKSAKNTLKIEIKEISDIPFVPTFLPKIPSLFSAPYENGSSGKQNFSSFLFGENINLQEKFSFCSFFYYQVSEIFQNFFSSMYYDTSSYTAIKYFQSHFEREIFSSQWLSTSSFHKIDSNVSRGPGRQVLLELLDLIISEDTYQVFSTAIEIDKLKIYKYNEIIRNPLDLSLIKANVSSGKYLMVECLLSDILQVFDNCMIFNQKDSSIHKEAERLKNFSLSHITAALSLFSEKVSFREALSSLLSEIYEPVYHIFHERVSEVEYPQYYIAVKHPMSISEIQNRAKTGYYKNLSHFEADFQRIHHASTIYNGQTSEITKVSKKLLTEVSIKISSYFPWYKSPFSKRLTQKKKETN